MNTLYTQLVEGKSVSRYPWLISQFYTDFLQTLLSRSYNSLEWCLNCPPKPHAFASLPLQSGFNTYIKRIINNIIIFIKLKSLFFITTLLKLLSFMHKYNTLYKIWLNRSSGQKVIIYIYLFLEIIAIALMLILIVWLLSKFNISLIEPVYCTEPVGNGYDELLARISRAQGNITYFQGQVSETTRLFNEAIANNFPNDVTNERLISMRESQTNLRLERRVLTLLQNRLQSGDYDTSFTTQSSLGKRKFE